MVIVKKKGLSANLTHFIIWGKKYIPAINTLELDLLDNAQISSGNSFPKDVKSFPAGKFLDDALEKWSWKACFKHFSRVVLYLLF